MVYDPSSKFTICVKQAPYNKVMVIKAIRVLTGMGLKEAKDASEIIGAVQTLTLTSGNSDTYIDEQFSTLRSNGVEVSAPVTVIIEELRKLGAMALSQGEDEFANEILQLVLAEKLRRSNGYR
jgi:hypothetical protein